MIVSLCILIILICIYIYFFPFIPKRKKHYTYALLLGCPAHDDGTMSSSQIKRCDLAIKMYQQNLYDTLIISGSNVKNKYVEAKVMYDYIQNKIDIPTILETKARNTFENFKLSKEYIQNQDVLILTSQTHAKRACAIAKQFFSDYGCAWFKDLKPKHIIREIASRIIYIKIEIQKKIGRY